MEPALGRPDAAEVREPLLVRGFRAEIAIQNIVGDDGSFAIVFRLAGTPGTGPHGILPHEPLDPVQAAGQTRRAP